MNALCNQHPDNKCTYIQILQGYIFGNIARVNTCIWQQGSPVTYIVDAAMQCVDLSPPTCICQTNISVHSLTYGDLPGCQGHKRTHPSTIYCSCRNAMYCVERIMWCTGAKNGYLGTLEIFPNINP